MEVGKREGEWVRGKGGGEIVVSESVSLPMVFQAVVGSACNDRDPAVMISIRLPWSLFDFHDLDPFVVISILLSSSQPHVGYLNSSLSRSQHLSQNLKRMCTGFPSASLCLRVSVPLC
jgi:hypothetical protein